MCDLDRFIIVTHGLVLFLAEGGGINGEALILGRLLDYMNKRLLAPDGGSHLYADVTPEVVGQARDLAMQMAPTKKKLKRLSYVGLFISIVGRVVVIVAGCILFGDKSLQCTYLASNEYQAPPGGLTPPLGKCFGFKKTGLKTNCRSVLEPADQHDPTSRNCST